MQADRAYSCLLILATMRQLHVYDDLIHLFHWTCRRRQCGITESNRGVNYVTHNEST